MVISKSNQIERERTEDEVLQPTIDVSASIDAINKYLLETQAPDGSWRFCYESGTVTDSFMIITLRLLQLPEQQLIEQLCHRLTSRQHPDGYWSVYPNETNGNLSTTVEAYYALLYSGCISKNDPILLKAKTYILSNGGLHKVKSVLTRSLLAATGQLPWPHTYTFPIEFLLLPEWSPISFYDIIGYARVHIAPILLLSSQPDSERPEGVPDLSDIIIHSNGRESDPFETWTTSHSSDQEHRLLLDKLKKELFQHLPSPQSIKQEARNKAESFILNRIEPNGTLYTYSSATFLMIFALLSLGYDRKHPRITKAVEGLKSLICHTGTSIHVQNSTATIWNTALISHALQETGFSAQHGGIQRAGAYLLSRQQHLIGDWHLHNPNAVPGGWGFSDINTIVPDIDDTTAALRAIFSLAIGNSTYADAYDKGLQWLLSMQNNDGGWPAFEKNTDKTILTWLPYEGADAALTDPSTADLTGRTLEYLGNTAKLTIEQPFIRQAVDWLLHHQEQDGSWYGKWGICYLYGTWAAVTGITAVGVHTTDPSLVRAARWLSRVQNPDGGWGESCESDHKKEYVPLHMSTPSQTAWALDALIAVSSSPTEEIHRGIQRLIHMIHQPNEAAKYPTGAGLPGQFYTYYHSYNYIWPLLTLAHYKRKYLTKT